VASSSPASQASIQTSDIITSIGGVALDGTHSFINILFSFKPGDQVIVVFNRNGSTQQVTLTLTQTTHG
jgi:S1-C subfamily serine protease